MEHLPTGVDHRSGYCSSNGVFYSKRPPVRIPENVDLLSCLFAGQFRDKVALIDAQTGRSLTYRQLEHDVQALATGLFRVLGVRQYDCVAILLTNFVEFPISFFAVTWLGAVVTTLNPMNTAQELRKQMSDAGAKYIITTAESLEKVSAANLPTVIFESMETDVPSKVSVHSFSQLLRTGPPYVLRPQSKQSDTVAILFSSGTTGRSKAVTLTHRNYVSTLLALNACEDAKLTRTLVILPMFHTAGFTLCTLAPLARGMQVVVLRKFELLSMLRAVQTYRVMHLAAVPPVLKALVDLDPESQLSNFDLRSLLRVDCGAAPLALETVAAFSAKFPLIQLSQLYGLTESTGCITSPPVGVDNHVGSSGLLTPIWEAMVIDLDTKQPVRPHKPGELWVRGPAVTKGYANDPKATEESIGKNGWLRTGDLVKFDDDGFLYIVDRLKELIKYNGFQVAPAELEDLLLSHPEVFDCAIIPYPDKESGQIPMACIIRTGGSRITAEEIMQWVANQVAPYKKVRKVAFMDSIPKSPVGKIQRRQLVTLMTLKSNL